MITMCGIGTNVISLSKSGSGYPGRIAIPWSYGRLGLRNDLGINRITLREAGPRHWGRAFPGPVCHDPVECCSLMRRLKNWKRDRAQSAKRTLQDLLASDLRFYLPERLFHSRRAGLDAGFFSYGP